MYRLQVLPCLLAILANATPLLSQWALTRLPVDLYTKRSVAQGHVHRQHLPAFPNPSSNRTSTLSVTSIRLSPFTGKQLLPPSFHCLSSYEHRLPLLN
ncbi:hypothetical protein QR685DRAFT_525872 [Neurospora intermedia]|uniref:Secreted protein n=1 Tax=Neurospora intermedia TaxID=5142 RepID=A0ABR3DHI8_NEUIN